MLDIARRGSLQEDRAKVKDNEEGHVARREERGRHKGGEVETGSNLKASPARFRQKYMQVQRGDQSLGESQ